MTTNNNYDYVIIGGGSAGCVVAARLAEEQQGTILLLEAGQNAQQNPEITTTDGFKYTFSNENTMWDRDAAKPTGTSKKPAYCGTGTGLGGSGSVNGMVYTRGDVGDFSQWPEGWRWPDIKPFFESLENRLGIQYREPTNFTEACINSALKLGFEHKNSLNDGNLRGYIGYNDMNFRGQERRSSYMSFIHGRESELPDLTVKTEVKVQRIVFDENKTATAVEVTDSGTLQTITANKEVILCAGALETPKLLMLSGIGPREELEKFSIPAVEYIESIGKNLQDHPNVCIFYKTNKPIDFFYPQLYGFDRINRNTSLPEGQADVCYTFFSVPSVIQETMKKMVPKMILPKRLHNIRPIRFGVRGLVNILFRLPPLQKFIANIYGIIVILGKPESRGVVKLKSNNPDDQAYIDVAYYEDPTDRETMLKAVELAHKMSEQTPLRLDWGSTLLSKAVASNDLEKINRWLDNATMTTFHFSGTCSMGPEADKPVATDLKLKGFTNVRIADASVIPTVPVSATNAPSMLIGYRAAEFIKQESLARTSLAVN
ncbi:GMC family oxidoreductase [Halioxenophilus sp. WMMB6]|uniref:GMC family oxidoreductase n=1 Tax=Halioxenophilus sp. WMMB6 TaxID=3073815 RepID=UPI00295E8C01|nr:GMC family oxidoreductase [Halioxenophilus sp. WMMB6]